MFLLNQGRVTILSDGVLVVVLCEVELFALILLFAEAAGPLELVVLLDGRHFFILYVGGFTSWVRMAGQCWHWVNGLLVGAVKAILAKSSLMELILCPVVSGSGLRKLEVEIIIYCIIAKMLRSECFYLSVLL